LLAWKEKTAIANPVYRLPRPQAFCASGDDRDELAREASRGRGSALIRGLSANEGRSECKCGVWGSFAAEYLACRFPRDLAIGQAGPSTWSRRRKACFLESTRACVARAGASPAWRECSALGADRQGRWRAGGWGVRRGLGSGPGGQGRGGTPHGRGGHREEAVTRGP
jgi:hypothetical protein